MKNYCCSNPCCPPIVYVPGPTGPIGRIGPTGPSGPTGPTGPSGTNLLSGLQMQLSAPEGLALADNEAVPFTNTLTNTTLQVNFTAPDIFTINQNGVYYISWQLLSAGSEVAPVPTFALVFSDGQIFNSTIPTGIEQISASALVNITSAPTTFQLVNVTGNGVFVEQSSYSANIVIMH